MSAEKIGSSYARDLHVMTVGGMATCVSICACYANASHTQLSGTGAKPRADINETFD